MLRNLAWGLMTALWGALSISIVSGIVVLLSREEASELAAMGGYSRLVISYAVAAVLAGAVLGLFRPLGRTRLGSHSLGGLVTTAAFLGFFAGMGGVDLSTNAPFVVPALFFVGFAMTPLWIYGSRKRFWPDFDAWLSNLVLTDKSEE